MDGGFGRKLDRDRRASEAGDAAPRSAPGKRTLTERLPPGAPAVQRVAAEGVAGSGGPLPHAHTIQQLFGRHDISGIQAHVGGAASEASQALGAEGYATGNAVAFAGAPSLHLAAHEAAHVVQQRHGVQLKGGVGEAGDPHERHADQVADAVVQGKSAERLLDQYATGAAARSVGVQRQAAEHAAPEHVDPTITDTPRVESVEILHAEEIFADLPGNTTTKKHAFDRLNKAVHAEAKAEQKVESTHEAEEKAKAADAKAKAAPATDKTAKSVAKAKAKAAKAVASATKAAAQAAKALTTAQTEVTAATEGIEKLVVAARMPKDHKLQDLKDTLAHLRKQKKQDAKAIAEAQTAIAERKDEIRAQVADLKHTDADHTKDSVFSPVATDVTHHDYAFADGEHVKVHDHVVSYATSVSFGVDSEGPIDHAKVAKVMSTAGLSESRRKILQAISGFEGGFDTVNTYDRAKVTWGFVQWTGGHSSDLTKTLAIIKANHPAAFAKAFQAYGIDLVGNDLVITPPGGTATIRGEAAADAIMQNPQLAAALAHAGRNEDVQKGEVEAAAQLEIDKALALQINFKVGKKPISTTAGALITSEYGVGLLANTFVHSGGGAAFTLIRIAIDNMQTKHPYVAGDEAWRAEAEAAIISALEARDSDRAASLRQQLETEAGSFT